jgi:hypothetical protein
VGSVDALELVGWVGSAVLVWSLLQTRILRLRVINLVGCVILIVYNGVAGVWPMLGLNVVLAVINVYYLRKLLSTRHSDASYEVVQVDADDAYLRYLMARHAADLATFYPGFDPRAPYGGEAYLVLRDEETVGYVLLHPEADGVARVDVDYVTERFRDFTPGEFVFRRSELLRSRGYRTVVASATPSSQGYYPRLGFRREGERYLLDVAA